MTGSLELSLSRFVAAYLSRFPPGWNRTDHFPAWRPLKGCSGVFCSGSTFQVERCYLLLDFLPALCFFLSACCSLPNTFLT